MNGVSQHAYDEVKYPWQSPVLEAVKEFDADLLVEKIGIAEDAIAKRLLELNGTANPEEMLAMQDAQKTLAVLKGQC